MGGRFAAGVAEALSGGPTGGRRPTSRIAVSEAARWSSTRSPRLPTSRGLRRGRRAGEFARDRGDRRRVGRRSARRRSELAGAPITASRSAPTSRSSCYPGEVFLEHGLAARAGSPFPETIVAAYNANTLQYIPTREAFPDGEYEVDGGWRYIRPGEGERMAAEAVRLLESLREG